MTTNSIFIISKFIESVTGKNYIARKLNCLEILVEVEDQENWLLEQNLIGDLRIKVTIQRSLNTREEVISEFDLKDETYSDHREGRSDEDVFAVKRIKMRRQNKELDTKHTLPTFHRSTLPEYVNGGFLTAKLFRKS